VTKLRVVFIFLGDVDKLFFTTTSLRSAAGKSKVKNLQCRTYASQMPCGQYNKRVNILNISQKAGHSQSILTGCRPFFGALEKTRDEADVFLLGLAKSLLNLMDPSIPPSSPIPAARIGTEKAPNSPANGFRDRDTRLSCGARSLWPISAVVSKIVIMSTVH